MKKSQHTITVRIWHGSIRKWAARKQKPELGGLFGGHVAVEIDEFVYGFFYKDKKQIHVFSNNANKNCEFQKQSLQEWNEIVADKKETLISFSVTKSDIDFLLDFYNANLISPCYDYSFFGMRCASSLYNLLKEREIIPGSNYVLNAFYPAQLRKKLVKEAGKQGGQIVVKEGAPDRIWA